MINQKVEFERNAGEHPKGFKWTKGQNAAMFRRKAGHWFSNFVQNKITNFSWVWRNPKRTPNTTNMNWESWQTFDRVFTSVLEMWSWVPPRSIQQIVFKMSEEEFQDNIFGDRCPFRFHPMYQNVRTWIFDSVRPDLKLSYRFTVCVQFWLENRTSIWLFCKSDLHICWTTPPWIVKTNPTATAPIPTQRVSLESLSRPHINWPWCSFDIQDTQNHQLTMNAACAEMTLSKKCGLESEMFLSMFLSAKSVCTRLLLEQVEKHGVPNTMIWGMFVLMIPSDIVVLEEKHSFSGKQSSCASNGWMVKLMNIVFAIPRQMNIPKCGFAWMECSEFFGCSFPGILFVWYVFVREWRS